MKFYESETISLKNTNEALNYLLNLDNKVLSDCVFRGHNNSSWGLQSSLDRYGKTNPEASLEDLRKPPTLKYFLDLFRGHYDALVGKSDLDDDELWQVAQHHGLPTPLLDVSKSPMVALFFALFNKDVNDASKACIWQIDMALLREMNRNVEKFIDSLDDGDGLRTRLGTVEYIAGNSTYSPRQYAQQGGFIRWKFFSELPLALKYWEISKAITHAPSDRLLRRIEFDVSREELIEAFRKLSLMNIAPRSLFPDVSGAAEQVKIDYLLRSSTSWRREYGFRLMEP
ncbi:FRG domain-containing protein [Cellvibrio sp. KY-YJ-3]|uniref:FRG domain-containing protein n=1 Tax=Cellvibrio sp. KY-YJ-3 TaxID=454662 RepID=UPI001246A81D|nr:FRG domain-containing protein [Cellvibrio sp. KY-YJ-3]QEY12373.1 FRG domain-containing protein [Cellvibrio sp. KY-YJ-3]